MRFKTRKIWPFNKREAYDNIETTWPDIRCLTAMIAGAILISFLTHVTLWNSIEVAEAHEKVVKTEIPGDWKNHIVGGDKKVTEEYIDTVQEDTLAFILKFEWLHTTAYWDVKRYSIWCWTISYKWEVITKEEAEYRCRKRIDTKRRQYDLYKYDDNVEIALLSFNHNIWSMPYAYSWYLDNWYYTALGNLMRKYIHAWWKPLRWLKIRRDAEANLLVNR